ncbi:hypothetical protein [Escherichia coli]|uniref:hypothetical protein n=1 Tax=Escherichia coli TaxID=562 RepID=UPI001F0F9D82|nr:hypothetical protein [Escherichia coli]
MEKTEKTVYPGLYAHLAEMVVMEVILKMAMLMVVVVAQVRMEQTDEQNPIFTHSHKNSMHSQSDESG